MADKAALLGQTLLDLLRGRRPTLPQGQWETNYQVKVDGSADISESPNKQAVSNANQLLWSFERKEWATVKAILDWWVALAAAPFMPKETNTGEEVYRALTAYPNLVAAGVAQEIDREDAFEAALLLARAHIAWALLGLGPVPGREVADHHLDAISKPCVLIGTKKPKYPIRRVAQAGKRGWVRNRDKKYPPKFQFLEHLNHGVMVYQALGWELPRKVRKAARWPVDTFAAFRERFPSVPWWGFNVPEIENLRDFAVSPTNEDFAWALLPYLKATSLPVQFSRYADGSVVSVLLRGDSSSTDSLMLDANYAGGEVRLTSADDGLRLKAVLQIAWEETEAFACQAEDHTGPVMRIPKPRAPLAHTIFSKDGRTWMDGDASEDASPVAPETPRSDVPPPVRPAPRPWWRRLLEGL